MFQIKICGVKSVVDAMACVEAGADAIGLNFHQPSPRSVDLATAHAIVQAVRGQVATVGVFVNRAPTEINELTAALSLDMVQLHGDEPAEVCCQLNASSIVRAIRIQSGQSLEAVGEYLRGWRDVQLAAVLIDAFKLGKFGGTGEVVDWRTLVETARDPLGIPLVLAGGLTPLNVADAIGAVKPAAVDTASGVESAPGVKSRRLVEEFVAKASAAFAAQA